MTAHESSAIVPATDKEFQAHAEIIDRVKRAKRAVVQILRDGDPIGSGVVLSKSGLIATAFHVVGKVVDEGASGERIYYSSNSAVRFNDGRVEPAIVDPLCTGDAAHIAAANGYCLLRVRDGTAAAQTYPLGAWPRVQEGTPVLHCGYPFGARGPMVSTGLLSRKATVPDNTGDGEHEIGWVDCPMNVGNFGGPIIAIGANPDQDRLIALAAEPKAMTGIIRDLETFETRFKGAGPSTSIRPVVRTLALAMKLQTSAVNICISIGPITELLQHEREEG